MKIIRKIKLMKARKEFTELAQKFYRENKILIEINEKAIRQLNNLCEALRLTDGKYNEEIAEDIESIIKDLKRSYYYE